MAQPMPAGKKSQPTALMVLEEEVRNRGCPGSGTPVFGEGSPVASLVLIGESPRGIEEKAGKPLAGRSLALLEQTLSDLGVSLASVWLTDAVKCRPVRQRGDRVYERAPGREEIDYWRPVLLREIEVLQPRVVVCLGGTAGSALLGRKGTIRDLRGQWLVGPGGVRVRVTYHPSYLLCKRGGSKELETARFVADLREAVSLIT